MAVSSKRKEAEEIEVDDAERPVSSSEYDELTYLPGPQDPPFTLWNGINFQANVKVKVPKAKTVLAPIRKEQQLQDGTIVSRAIEQRLSMADLAKGNPHFMVNGVKPASRKVMMSRMPGDAHAYKSYATEWLAKCDTEVELVSRWDGEQALRDKLGVDQAELQHIWPFLEARRDALKGLHGSVTTIEE